MSEDRYVDPAFNDLIDQVVAFNEEAGTVMNDSGKRYTLVKDRIDLFRRAFGMNLGIMTAINYPDGLGKGCPVIATAQIQDHTGRILAMGHAVEWCGLDSISGYAPVEVAETSAIGRALACFGMHGGEYASGNEIERVISKRAGGDVPERPVPPRQTPKDDRKDIPPAQMTGLYIPDDRQGWTPEEEVQGIFDALDKIGSAKELEKYHSELKPWIDEMKQSNKAAAEEVLAAFSVVFEAVQ